MVVRRLGRNQPWCNAEKHFRQREELIQKFLENSSARLLCRWGLWGLLPDQSRRPWNLFFGGSVTERHLPVISGPDNVEGSTHHVFGPRRSI